MKPNKCYDANGRAETKWDGIKVITNSEYDCCQGQLTLLEKDFAKMKFFLPMYVVKSKKYIKQRIISRKSRHVLFLILFVIYYLSSQAVYVVLWSLIF